MRVLAFAASTSRNSINRQLLDHAIRVLTTDIAPDVEVETIDLIDYEMPIFSVDREAEDGIPQEAHDLFAKIGASDAVLVSFAEHNGYYTAAYKNTFDWMSRIDIKVYQGKPTVMLATSPGPRGGRNVLKTAVTSAPFFGNDVRGELSVPSFGDNFEAGALVESDHIDALAAALTALVAPAGTSDTA